MAVMIKLLMKWDIKPGHEQSYFEFVMQEFAPGLMRLGLQPTEAWYTVYGKGPQFLTGVVTEDLETMRNILGGDEWHRAARSAAGARDELQPQDHPGHGTFSALTSSRPLRV